MPASGPTDVGNSTGLTVAFSTSVSVSVLVSGSPTSSVRPPSTLFPSSSPSSPTSDSTAAVNTLNRLLKMLQSRQTASSSSSSLFTSSAGHIGSSYTASSATFTASATTNSFTGTNELDVSHTVGSSVVSFPVEYTKAVSSTSATPAAYDSTTPSGGTSSTLATQNESVILVSSADPAEPSVIPVLIAPDASAIQGTSLRHHRDHPSATSTSVSAPGLASTRVPTSTPTSVSSISYSTLSTTVTRESIAPESVVPVPTTSSIFNNSSTSNSLLPVILGSVLGALVIVALGIIAFRCRARRRSANLSNALSGDSETLQERKYSKVVEATPQVNAIALGRRITSYQVSSTYTPEHITTYISKAGESSQSRNGRLSDPFADSSEMVSSRTSMPPASIHSTDSLSTIVASESSENADTRDAGDFGNLMDASTSSLELRFVAPLMITDDDSSTRPPHLSPSWHYDGLSPTCSPKENGYWNEEGQSETPPLSPPASPSKPFCLGTESARLRLHELLKEARRV